MRNCEEGARRWVWQVIIIALLVIAYWAVAIYFQIILGTNVVYSHFAYIPIALAAMWWGRKVLLVAGVLASAILILRVLGAGAGKMEGDLIRVGLLFVVALCIGELRETVKRSENALSVSEKKYRQFTEKSLAGIFVYRDDRVVYVNPRSSEMLGYTTEDSIGKSIWEVIYQGDKEKVREYLRKRSSGGSPDLRYECRIVKGDGAITWVDLASTVVEYENAPAIMVYMYDITDKKEAEQKRRELSELARIQEEQLVHSTRLAELGEMAAAVAHELNQPLTGIRNFARNAVYMIEEGAGSPGEVKDNLILISDQVDRASRIIGQMRELTRRSERQFAPMNINDTLKESVEFLMPQLQLSKVETTLELAEDLPEVLGEKIRLEQVFLNLLTNARQAMAETDERCLVVKTYFDAANERPVTIEVCDTGKGFAQEDAEKLFAPFYSTKKPGHGTGLGLSISLSIIKEHNGTVKARAATGKGARFTVRLPAVQEQDDLTGSRSV